jgi:hypothetical protein
MSYAAAAAARPRQPYLTFNPFTAHKRIGRQLPLPKSKADSGLFDRLGVEVVATAHSGEGVVHSKAFHAAYTHLVNVVVARYADVAIVHEQLVAPGGATAAGKLLLATQGTVCTEHYAATEFVLNTRMSFTPEGVLCDAVVQNGFSIACKPAFDLTDCGWTKVVLDQVPFMCFRDGLTRTLLKACPAYQHLRVVGEFAGSSDLHGCTTTAICKNTVVAFVEAPAHDRMLRHLPRSIDAWEGFKVSVRVSFDGSTQPSVWKPPPPPGSPPVRSNALHTTHSSAQVGTTLDPANVPSPMEDVQHAGPSPMEVEPVVVSVSGVQGHAQVTPADSPLVLDEVVVVEEQDVACLEWLRDNGLGEEATGCDITSEMRVAAVACVRAEHASMMHTITGSVPPEPVRQLLQAALRRVFEDSFTPVEPALRGRARKAAPPQTTKKSATKLSNASAHMQRIGTGKEPARPRSLSSGRVEGSQHSEGSSEPTARVAHVRSLSPVQRPRASQQAAYVTLRGRVVPPPGPSSLVRGAPMPPVA